MIKTHKKWISVLLTLTLLAALLLPMATPALAAGSAIALSAPTRTAGTTADLGTLYIEIPAGQLSSGNLVVSLPDDFTFDGYTAGGNLVTGAATNGTAETIPEVVYPADISGDTNALNGGAWLTKAQFLDNKSFTINAANVDPTNKAFLYVYLQNVNIPAGYTGDVNVTLSANSGWPTGSVKVAVVGDGKTTITMDKVPSFTDSTAVKMYLTETGLNGLKKNASSVKIKLPAGFEWTGNGALPTTLWGDDAFRAASLATRDADTRTMIINTSGAASNYPTSKSSYVLTGNIQVSDTSVAKMGKVVATITGESDLAIGELEMATYSDFSNTVTAAAPTEVMAGKEEQDIADITIEEGAVGSLVQDRFIYLELPAGASWDTVNGTGFDNAPAVSNMTLSAASAVGSDNRIVKYTVTADSTANPGKITFEDQKIILAGDFTGDVKVSVYGSAGAKGEVVVAKATAPVTLESTLKEVKLGVQAQEIGDIILTETVKGALEQTGTHYLTLDLPAGTKWSGVPTVTVEDGDLTIDANRVVTDSDLLHIYIKGDSSKPSKIKVAGAKITVDRTYPEGALKVALKGNAVIDDDSVTRNPATTDVGSYVIATCVTAAPGEVKANAAFKIGETNFTLNGVAVTMDAAPYIKDGRTYLPLRYVAQALGVSDSNILWDAATQKVTLIKGSTFVQLTIGSSIMMVNGMPITMDVAPEITSDRTCLPIRFVAQVLGADVAWDEATQTVTLK